MEFKQKFNAQLEFAYLLDYPKQKSKFLESKILIMIITGHYFMGKLYFS